VIWVAVAGHLIAFSYYSYLQISMQREGYEQVPLQPYGDLPAAFDDYEEVQDAARKCSTRTLVVSLDEESRSRKSTVVSLDE